jgi:photosystem II stability/assembly factor-like uncharacterized protein
VLLLKATTESLQVTNSVPGLVPTIKGYTYINQAVGTAFTISPDQTISTGDWMIMVLETYSTVTWTDPTGWTVIQSSTLAGTLVTAIYAKIRVAGETSYTLSMPAYDNASTLTLMWGSGAAPIANWVIGTNMLRGNITPATSYNNLAPSITTTSNNNLVLTISSERYTGVTETSIAGMTGAIQWLFKGELNTTEIETICVGYVQQATAGATSNVTITYYYPQAVNGMAIQIGIPPSTGNIDYSVSYDDSLSGSVSMSSNEGKITYPTTSAILAAPAVSTTRLIKLITISNTDPYVNNVVVVQKNINSTTYNVGSIMLLQPGETVQYIDKRGWKHYGSSGVIVADLTLNNSSTGQLQYNSSNVLDNVTNPVAFTITKQYGSGIRSWNFIGMSSDGTHIFAAINNNYISVSADGGVTWTIQSSGLSTEDWTGIVSSADGTHVAAVNFGGPIFTSTNSGVTWTSQAGSGSRNWLTIATSSDGTHLAAAVQNSSIYTSPDSGVTWNVQAGSPSLNWRAIGASSDGTKLVGVGVANFIYTSTDSGVTWTQRATSQNWQAVTSSADGTHLAAAVNPGFIYTSTDSGVTWTQRATSQAWGGISSSSDGTRLVANADPGYIYTSIDSGVTWTKQTSATSQTWGNIVASADGTKFAVNQDYIYTGSMASQLNPTWSTAINSGAQPTLQSNITYSTWTQTAAPSQVWSAIASSSDGSHLVAANTSNGYIYTSTDYGVTWTQTAAPSQVWSAIASSSDGSHLVAANTSNGYIYTDVISLGYNVALGSPSGLVPVVPLSVARSGVFQASQAFIQQTNSTSINWRVITSSADGTKLAAATASNYIYTSSDSGYTWTQQTSSTSQFWGGITSSADGTKLAATVGGSNIYTSTNSGVTWTPQTGSPSVGWAGITSSSDGTHLAAVVNGGYIYTSTNTGVTWTQQTGSTSQNWYTITSSSDGTHLAAVVNGGYIYTSTNTGVTWTQQTSTILNWHAIASSADGTKLAAVVYGGYIYTSTNSGVTWTQQTGSTSQNWYTITSSSDGTHLAAVVNGGYIYTSTNTGVTWTPQTNATSQNWYAITSSSDGTKLAAAVGGGYIYTISIPQNETNILALPGGNAKLALQAWNADPNSPPRVVATGAAGSYVSATKTAAVTVPTGVVSGSLIVVFIYATWPNSPTFPAAVTVPTGFYLGGSWPYQDTVYSKYSGTAWYYKYATSTDVGTYNFVLNNDSLGGSPQYGNGYAHIISNGPTSGNPFVDTVLFGDSSTATTSMTVGTFTPGANNSLLLAGVGWDYDGGAGGAILGFPTGWGSIAQDDDTANTVLFGTGYTVQSTAAATGALTFTTNKTSPGNVIVMTIRPTATTSSYALNTNTLSMYARTSAANTTLSVIDPTLATMSLQNALWQNNVISWTPGPSNVGTWMGTSGTNVNSGGGTTLSTLPTTTNVYTAMRRTTIATAVTTTNQQVGLRSELMFMRGATGGQGGFFFSCRFGFDAIATGCRAFVGFTTTTTITSVDSSTLTNILGFGFDVADTAWSFYHNSAAATATKESIPGQGTLATSNTGYDAYIWAPPDSAVVYYRLDRTDTGATIVDSSVSTNLPATTTPLLATAMMSNGTANTAVGAATIGINRLYVETLR